MTRMNFLQMVILITGLFEAVAVQAGSCSSPPISGSGSGASSIAYQNWCRSCGGTVSFDAASNPRCTPSANWRGTGAGGGYTAQEQAALNLARAGGQMIGEALREMIFGNPQEEARRHLEAEAARARAEEERRAREAEAEARKQRLMGEMMGIDRGPELALIMDGSADTLSLKLGDDALPKPSPARTESAARQLNHAVYLSQQAWTAKTPEQAVVLANAAFDAAIGGVVDARAPDQVLAAPVSGSLEQQFKELRERFLKRRMEAAPKLDQWLQLEEQRALSARLRAETEKKIVAMERSGASGQELARLRALREESLKTETQLASLIAQSQSETRASQRSAMEGEQELRNLIASLSKLPSGDKSQNYVNLGFQDATLCFSQNSGARCRAVNAPDFDNCLKNYMLGYRAGEKAKSAMLDDARALGKQTKLAGRAGFVDGDSRALGSCRYDYVMAYNSGYFETRTASEAISRHQVNKVAKSKVPADELDPEVARIINGIMAAAKRQGMSEVEQDRLKKAMFELTPEYEPKLNTYVISENWKKILTRQSTMEYATEAAKGEGPGLYGAGKQGGPSEYNDCAIYAIATATGKPYGVVASRATEMIRDAEWRSAKDRANSQGVFGKGGGLNGGEVIMLAETFGQVKIVIPSEFAQTLKAGQPVMVDVATRDGDIEAHHQVVLAKTFLRGGETWYEVIDSHEGPMRRLHMSATELKEIMHDNGISFRPEPRSTPQLLRSAGEGR